MKTDIEIAQETKMLPITTVASQYGITEDDLELYGKYKAKISNELWQEIKDRPDGKLVLVTAINPTPAGEGKTTTSIGLAQAMTKCGKKAMLALREPSLGPCFGIKGGAAGGGYAQVVPMEDLNLHFTGDFHAITTANNLSGSTSGQPYPAGKCSWNRPETDPLEEMSGHERPCAEKHCSGTRRKGRRLRPRRPFCDHGCLRDHGDPLSGNGYERLEGASRKNHCSV